MERASNKRVTIFAIILSLAAVGVLVFGFMMVSSNKVVMLQSISNLYGKVTDISEEQANLLDKLSQSNDIGLRGNINLKMGKDEYAFNVDLLENRKDSKSNFNIVGKNNNKEVVNGNIIFDKNNLYIFFKDITTNYYKVATDYSYIFRSISSDDYDKLVYLLKDSIDSSIKNDDIKKEKTTIKLNGKNKNVNKLTYTVTNKTVEEILTKFVKSIKADKSLMNDMANYLGISNKELKKQLDDSVKYVKKNKNQEIFKYQVYYYGINKIVQYEIYSKENDVLLQYIVDDKEHISITSNGTNYLTLDLVKNKKTYTFTGNFLNTYDFSGTFSDNLLELVFKFDKEYRLNIVYSNDNNENSFKNIYQISLSSKKNDKEKKMFIADADLEFYFGEKIDNEIDISNALDLDEEVLNNLLQDNFGISLEQLLTQFSIPNQR